MKEDLIRRVRELPVSEQIQLVEEIWDGIADQNGALPVTAAQQIELDHRLADYRAHPNDIFDWAEVKAAALAKK
jgi:putative addiction module component (TIGR02574 family)